MSSLPISFSRGSERSLNRAALQPRFWPILPGEVDQVLEKVLENSAPGGHDGCRVNEIDRAKRRQTHQKYKRAFASYAGCQSNTSVAKLLISSNAGQVSSTDSVLGLVSNHDISSILSIRETMKNTSIAAAIGSAT
jgi:hypothetical protein